MKPIISHPKHSPLTTIIGFDYSDEKRPHPHEAAHLFLVDRGYQVSRSRGKDRGIYTLCAERGDPENDPNPDVHFYQVRIMSRFYVSPKGKVGAQCAYQQFNQKQLDMGVETIYATWDGFCAFTMAEVVEKFKAKVLKLARKK